MTRVVARFLRQECTFCGRRPGEYLSRTPAVAQRFFVGGQNTPAPDWLPRDPETRLRFCRETCRSLYSVKGGIPPRHKIQPQTVVEEGLVAAAGEEEWSNADDKELVAVPDEKVARNVSTGFIIGRVVVAAALLLAVAEFPYSYYQILRFIVLGIGLWGVYDSHAAGRQGWMWVFGVLAVLFNPVMPISLGREAWVAVDIVSGVVLLASLRYLTAVRDVPTLDFELPWWEAGSGEAIPPRDWPSDEAWSEYTE